MNPNPRIHRPSARSFLASESSTPTITQSTALWKAMRRRQQVGQAPDEKVIVAGGWFFRLRQAVAGLPVFRGRR